ncbi:hypothetical protein I4N56_006735 [Pseudomonas mohnii]|uniref:hypothetical protein n=1 Tax=Pseudomonas mohnii TaxID=395600 RepID=UPI0018DC9183|nr:hypothetical protein [Pseudomonas mohnii]MBH8610671.1 hypothetical protein [Pseudomonas mohnii]
MPLYALAGAAAQAVFVDSRPSALIFAAGDEVVASNSCLPFWMTVTSVNERNGYCRCNFGSSGNYAGNFHHSELRFHGGAQIDQLAS